MSHLPAESRSVGRSSLTISPVAMGCWPIAGMTSVDVNDRDSLATLRAAHESGVTHFDTAYCYGVHGESERLIAQALGSLRETISIATKCGIHWDGQGIRQVDGRPERIQKEFHESLTRLETDYVDLLYLHAPDPKTPLELTAETFVKFVEAGKTRGVGASNFTVEQLEVFHEICPLSAVQPPYNMLQRQIESDIIPWCQTHHVAVIVYWPLMKGLLAGKIDRDYQFPSNDGRAKYPMFQGDEFQRNQDFLDELKSIALSCGKSVAQVVINWTIHQPGITAALCGAKRAHQIEDNAGGMGWRLTDEQRARIEQALARRGIPVVRNAV